MVQNTETSANFGAGPTVPAQAAAGAGAARRLAAAARRGSRKDAEPTVEALLAAVPLFASLSRADRSALAEMCIVAEFRQGEVVARADEYPRPRRNLPASDTS